MVPDHSRRELILGVAAGLVFALGVVLVARLEGGEKEAVAAALNFVVSLPALVLWNAPAPVQKICFIAYWIGVGGATGWLLGRAERYMKAGALLFVAILAVAHRVAQLRLEMELAGAMESVAAAIANIFLQ